MTTDNQKQYLNVNHNTSMLSSAQKMQNETVQSAQFNTYKNALEEITYRDLPQQTIGDTSHQNLNQQVPEIVIDKESDHNVVQLKKPEQEDYNVH